MIARRFTELDELLIFLQSKGFAGELRSADSLDGSGESGEELEHGSITSSGWIEPAEINTHPVKMILYKTIMFRFIADLTCKSQFHFDFGRSWNPGRRNLAGFQFVFECHLQSTDN